MGLDMYLSAKKYVSGYDHASEAERSKYLTLLRLFGLNGNWKAESPSAHAELTVAYWRKANQVHAWFVREVQHGSDEGQTAYVERSQLNALLGVCKAVKADPAKAPELLPTQSGFFFGSTDYDEYYMQDIDRTIKQLDDVLAHPGFDHCSFYYHASW